LNSKIDKINFSVNPMACIPEKIVANVLGAGKKTGISEIRYIDIDISEIDINGYI
jgi:hypothetical protein